MRISWPYGEAAGGGGDADREREIAIAEALCAILADRAATTEARGVELLPGSLLWSRWSRRPGCVLPAQAIKRGSAQRA